MAAPALLVAIPLVAGVVAGALSQAGTSAALCVLALTWVAAAAGLWRRRALVVTAAIVAASFCAGFVRGSGASRAAANPSLLTWFHESPSHADPVILTAVLREDAAPGASGVSVVADATAVPGRAVHGGVRVSIAGALAGEARRQWRGGRTVTITVALPEPLD